VGRSRSGWWIVVGVAASCVAAIVEHIERGAFARTSCYDCHRPGGAQPKYAGDRPFALLLSADGARLLVSHLRSSNLVLLDLGSGAIARTVQLAPSGSATEPVALARVGDEIWVALRPPQPSTRPGALRRLDAATLAPLGELPTSSDPASLLALSDGVLVAEFDGNAVTRHARDGAPVRHEVAPGPLGLTALPSGGVLALDYYANAISFIDLTAGTSRTLPLERDGTAYANPTHAAVSSDGSSAWIVTSGTDGHLLELDLGSTAILRDVPIDGLSFGVAVVRAPGR
jgi:hypothetical protein